MQLVVQPSARDMIDARGGSLYVWAKGTRCCRGRTFWLECTTEHSGRDVELVHASDGFRVFAPAGLLLPDELHLDVDRRGHLRAFWNGQAWIG